MSILWQSSLVPFIDANGDPYSGAKAYFYDAGTTTPLTVYTDSGLGVSHDSPVEANSGGMFPAVFLPAADFRLRITTAAGVVIWDIDGISTPQASTYVPPDAGDTDLTLLARTGDIKARHGTGAHTGWVRAAGRTIGNASSGASERANADCSDLFQFLWDADSTLAVSGGRGASAAGDFAANKKIDLPDYRGRALIGLASMGNSASTLIPDSQVDASETADTLGATVGASAQTLTTAQIPSHNHTATTNTTGAHTHSYVHYPPNANLQFGSSSGRQDPLPTTGTTGSSGDHSHTVTVANNGGGGSHPNVQPSALVTLYIKL